MNPVRLTQGAVAVVLLAGTLSAAPIGKMDLEIREKFGLQYPPEVQPVSNTDWADVFRIQMADGSHEQVKLLSVQPKGLRVMDTQGVRVLEGKKLSEGARVFFSHSGLGGGQADAVQPGPDAAPQSPVSEPAPSGDEAPAMEPPIVGWRPMPWQGVIHLRDGTQISAVVDARSQTHLKLTVAGNLRVIPIKDLHTASLEELGIAVDPAWLAEGSESEVSIQPAPSQSELERKAANDEFARKMEGNAAAYARKMAEIAKAEDARKAREESLARGLKELQRLNEQFRMEKLRGK